MVTLSTQISWVGRTQQMKMADEAEYDGKMAGEQKVADKEFVQKL